MATDKNVATTRPAGAAESKDSETSKGPVVDQGAVSTNVVDNEAKSAAQDKRLEEMSEKNKTGHDKNLEKITKDAEAAHKATEDKPSTGKEWNRNTPRIDEHGNKHWS